MHKITILLVAVPGRFLINIRLFQNFIKNSKQNTQFLITGLHQLDVMQIFNLTHSRRFYFAKNPAENTATASNRMRGVAKTDNFSVSNTD